MPIYEYRCTRCKSKFSVLVRSWNGPSTTVCPRCGEPRAERVMSTFAYHKSVKDIHEESGEPSMESGPDFYRDPRNIGRWTEKKFADMGVDVPPEIREEIDAARDGQLPDSLTGD
jgi:putative FmdB family regulatory protein